MSRQTRQRRRRIPRVFRGRSAWNFVRRVQAQAALRTLQALLRKGGA